MQRLYLLINAKTIFIVLKTCIKNVCLFVVFSVLNPKCVLLHCSKKLCQIAKESGHAPLQMDRSRLQMTCAEAALCHYCKEYTRVEESAQKVKLNRCQK